MRLLEIYQKYPILVKAINFINLTNQSSNRHPYHSIDHLFTVFKSCVDVSSFSSISDQELELELFIAALFHDYGHKGVMGNDHDNIVNAIDGLNFFYAANPEFNIDIVISLIQATEYPYVVEEKDLTIEAKILRDADMSYLFDDLSIVKLYSGLRKEFGQDLTTFINNQSSFLNNMKFYIPSNQQLWEICKPLRLAELKLISENV